ncbi:MAG TPA: HD domain-containing protein, partial [Solirubrobacteraceae bacterium]|nr:HD domain-containing protein [Solirubrobacteraceae bacterium]
AGLLRRAGCSDVVVAAGLLDDVLETTPVSADELTACFGADVAALVRAVSDDAHVGSYRDRKQLLREQVRRIGGDAAVLFAADKIAKVREISAAGARGATDASGARRGHAESRREHHRRVQLEHYHESLELLRTVAPHHPLVHRLADELAGVPAHA